MLYCVLLVAGLAAGAFCGCPEGWSYYEAENKCLTVQEKALNFEQARANCKSFDSDLVMPRTKAKEDFIYDVMKGDGWMYVGIRDVNKDRKWTYLDGSPLASFHPWAAGQPDNRNNEEYCVSMTGQDNRRWSDASCSYRLYSVCEKEAPPVLHCPAEWSQYDAEDKCLKAFRNKYTFDQARSHCKDLGSDLVVIRSKAKEDFIYDDMNQDGWMFIGIRDFNKDRTFTYVDGSPLGSYHPWGSGQPDNYKNAEFCVNLFGKGSRQWNDVSCGYKLPFICEKDVEEIQPTTVAPTTQQPTTTTEMAKPEYDCPAEWSQYDAEDKCLKAFRNKYTFDQARSHCKDLGSDLVMIRSKAKADFIYDDMNQDGWMYIGIQDFNKDKTFTYVDGSPLGSYHPWASGQPDHYKNSEFCVNLFGKGSRQWNDISCGYKLPFICEKDAEEIQPTTVAPTTQQPTTTTEMAKPEYDCPAEWSQYDAEDKCLKAFRNKYTFDQARSHCKDLGSDLVMIRSKAKADFIYDDMNQDGWMYIGIQDFNKDKTFTYVDGSPLGSYHPWASGQPDHYKNSEFCVNLFGKGSRQWNDISCGYKLPFICEKDAEEIQPTTVAPTTVAPTTAAPTTVAPTTVAPTTVAPTTVAPTTQQPTTTTEMAKQEYVCDKPYHLYAGDSTCLRYVVKTLTFDNARSFCADEGGDLVQIRDDRKRDFIFHDMRVASRIFIGIHDFYKDGRFSYVDGSPLTDYKPWSAGQPDHHGNNEFCVDLWNKGDKGWNDINCNRRHRFVCEKKPNLKNVATTTEQPTTTTPATPPCPKGWFHYGDEGLCYGIYKNRKTFDDARAVCKARGGDLISKLHNEEQKKVLTGVLGKSKYQHWIGIFDSFKYTDGEPLGNFHAFSPKEGFRNGHEYCVVTKQDVWRFLKCDQKRRFICQIPAGNGTPQ